MYNYTFMYSLQAGKYLPTYMQYVTQLHSVGIQATGKGSSSEVKGKPEKESEKKQEKRQQPAPAAPSVKQVHKTTNTTHSCILNIFESHQEHIITYGVNC